MTIRIGLVGCGRWGRNILRDLVDLGATVLVATPHDEDRRDAFRIGAAAAVASSADLGDVDGLIVATPTSSHALEVTTGLERGVPVFVEKPLTASASDAAAVLDAQRAAGTPVFVMEKWRHHPGIRTVSDMAHRGDMGRIRRVETVRVQPQHHHADVDAVWTLAPHDLSIIDEILGELPPALAAVGEPSSRAGWLDGLHGVLGDGRVGAHLTVSTRHVETERRLLVVGDDATVLLRSADESRLSIRNPEGEVHEHPVGRAQPLRLQLAVIVEYLRDGGPPPPATIERGVLAVRSIDGLRALAEARI